MSLLDAEYQAAAQQAIQRALVLDRVPHAYIFHGPDGVGKELFAKGFAQRLLCGTPKEFSLDQDRAQRIGLDNLVAGCGECDDCRMMAADTHPDLNLVHRHLNRDHPDPEVRKRKGLDLSIDVVRHFMIDRSAMGSMRGRGKVFIVREADRITPGAQNAMLKTLEEPPAGTIIVLLVRSIDRMLPTTLSRCQAIRFDALPREFIAEKLSTTEADLTDEEVRWYAQCGDGSVGLALARADEGLFERNARLLPDLAKIDLAGSTLSSQQLLDEAKTLSDLYKKRDPEISQTEATRRALKTLLHLMATWYSDILRMGSGMKDSLVNKTQESQLAESCKRWSSEQAASAVSRIASAEYQLDRNVNAQLCMDSLLIDLGRRQTA